jgi:hypothetical protein
VKLNEFTSKRADVLANSREEQQDLSLNWAKGRLKSWKTDINRDNAIN